MKHLKLIVAVTLLVLGAIILMPQGDIDEITKSTLTSRDVSNKEFKSEFIEQKVDVAKPNLGSGSKLDISGDLNGIKFNSSISKDAADLNKEILAVSQRYASLQPNMLKMGKHMMYYMPALSFQEWGTRPKGAEDVIACVDLTPETYAKSQGKALQLYNHKNTFGGKGFDDGVTYSQGPLQYTEGILGNKGVKPEELGVIGSASGPRIDKLTGKVGDRWNWYDSCNNVAKSFYVAPPPGITTPEETVALYAMYHNFGMSVAMSKNIDKVYNSGNIEKMSPKFAQTWCKTLARPELVNKYKEQVYQFKPKGKDKNTAKIINDWYNEAWALLVSENQALINSSYVNVNNKLVKTKYPVQVMVYMFMIEGRSSGLW